MKKRIKSSKRGLTFSLEEENISVGSKYRYILDKERKQIAIIPDANGPLSVSKKKVGKKLKPLFDLRSKEVRELVAKADYLEVEVKKNQIIVYTCVKEGVQLALGNIFNIEDILQARTGKIVLSAVSGESCYQYSITDWLSSQEYKMSQTEMVQVSSELQKVYDVVSLFSGAGLFDKAWLNEGRFRFVYANDFCKDVIETYKHNIGDHITCKDVREVSPDEIPFSDVFCTSPCCQAFSNANRHNINSKEGEQKRLLIDEVVRLVLAKKPKVVVVENVPQMITKENGLYIDRILQGLPNYEFSVQVVTDCDCGGYSNRKRCIVIGSRIGKIELPKLKVLPYKTVKDALAKVDATWCNFNDVTKPSEKTQEIMSYVPQGGNWKSVPESIHKFGPDTHSSIYRRLELNQVSPTITNFRKSNILHPELNRTLSVSEAAAIMGLNKDFVFKGTLSAMQQMVANGVTQAIGKLVSKTVLKHLDLYEAEEVFC